MHADAQAERRRLGRGVGASEVLVQLESAAHGVHRIRKLGQKAIAERVRQAAAGMDRDHLGHRRSAGGQGLEPLGMLAVASQDLVTLGCIHRR